MRRLSRLIGNKPRNISAWGRFSALDSGKRCVWGTVAVLLLLAASAAGVTRLPPNAAPSLHNGAPWVVPLHPIGPYRYGISITLGVTDGGAPSTRVDRMIVDTSSSDVIVTRPAWQPGASSTRLSEAWLQYDIGITLDGRLVTFRGTDVVADLVAIADAYAPRGDVSAEDAARNGLAAAVGVGEVDPVSPRMNYARVLAASAMEQTTGPPLHLHEPHNASGFFGMANVAGGGWQVLLANFTDEVRPGEEVEEVASRTLRTLSQLPASGPQGSSSLLGVRTVRRSVDVEMTPAAAAEWPRAEWVAATESTSTSQDEVTSPIPWLMSRRALAATLDGPTSLYALDFQPPSSGRMSTLTIDGLDPEYANSVEWSEKTFGGVNAPWSAPAFDFTVCGVRLYGESSFMGLMLDSSAVCLSLPTEAFNTVMAWAPSECTNAQPPGSPDPLVPPCRVPESVGPSEPLPWLSFKLSEGGQPLYIPLRSLVVPGEGAEATDDGEQYYCILEKEAIEPALRSSSDPHFPSIVLGSLAMRSLYVVMDIGTTKMGMAPKVAPADLGAVSDGGNGNCAASALPSCIGGDVYDAARNTCVAPDCGNSYAFQDLDEDTHTCYYATWAKALAVICLGTMGCCELLCCGFLRETCAQSAAHRFVGGRHGKAARPLDSAFSYIAARVGARLEPRRRRRHQIQVNTRVAPMPAPAAAPA